MRKSLLFIIAPFWSVNSVMGQSPVNCLNFDGQNDFVPLTNQIVLPNEFTIEAWIKTTVDGSILSGSDVALNQDFVFGIDCAKLRFQMVSNSVVLSFTSNPIIIADNNWHHVALTKNSSGLFSMYVDGVMTTPQNSPSVPVIFSQIGTSMSLPNFNGSLDELRVWNVARTGAKINGAKDSELLCSNSGLVAYYQFNKGISEQINTGVTSLTGLTANDNNGTLTNFALTGASSNWLAGSSIVTGNTCTTLNVDNIVITSNINVYPNPTNGNVNVTVNNLTNVSISVYDLNGRQILNKELSAN